LEGRLLPQSQLPLVLDFSPHLKAVGLETTVELVSHIRLEQAMAWLARLVVELEVRLPVTPLALVNLDCLSAAICLALAALMTPKPRSMAVAVETFPTMDMLLAAS